MQPLGPLQREQANWECDRNVTGEKSGSISIYLALTLIIIMAMLLSMLEAARMAAAESYSEILLRTAVESVMGEFYGPLWENYHLYGIDTGYGTTKGSIDELENRLERYMGNNVWAFRSDGCNVTEYERFLADRGQTYIDQAVAYEKYAAVGTAVEEIIDRVGALKDYGKTLKIYERSVPIENELAEIDSLTLELMEKVDGIDLTGGGISDTACCSVAESFAKKIYVGTVSPEALGINNPGLFEIVRNSYRNPLESLELVRQSVERLSKAETVLEEADNEIEQCEQNIRIIETVIEANKKQQKNFKAELKQLKKEKKNLKKHDYSDNEMKMVEDEILLKQKEIDELDKTIEKQNQKLATEEAELDQLTEKRAARTEVLDEVYGKMMNLLQALDVLLEGEKESTAEALEILEEIDSRRRTVTPMISDYEIYLDTFNGIIGADTMDGLKESLHTMKGYAIGNEGEEMITDFDKMRTSLKSNLSLLDSIPENLFEVKSAKDKVKLQKISDELENVKSVVSNLKYDGMNFDYSHVCAKNSTEDYEAIFNGWVAGGIMNMILGGEAIISDSVMTSNLLPGTFLEIQADSGKNIPMMTGESGMNCLKLFDEISTEGSIFGDIESFFSEIGNSISSKVLLELYQSENFKCYADNENIGDTILEYEQEYILSGLHSDSENLLAAAYKILMLRFAADSLYVICSPEIMNEAELTATLALGFTGLPFLIKAAAFVIALVMAFAQAIVETAAIFSGKPIALIPTKDSFCVSVYELPFITNLVSEKAADIKESQLGLDYEGYIMLFLLLEDKYTQTGRALDIIQENIIYQYDEDFLLYNCITGFSVQTDFAAESRYVSIFDGRLNILGLNGLRIKALESIHY